MRYLEKKKEGQLPHEPRDRTVDVYTESGCIQRLKDYITIRRQQHIQVRNGESSRVVDVETMITVPMIR